MSILSQNNLKEKSGVLIVIGGFFAFVGAIMLIFFYLGNASNENRETSYVDSTSGQSVIELKNEPERANVNYNPSITYVGFSSLYEKLGAEKYELFQTSTNSYLKENGMGSVEYVSLKRNSVETSGNIKFIIVLDSDTNKSYSVEYSKNNFSYSKI